jgi:hypothetical protein
MGKRIVIECSDYGEDNWVFDDTDPSGLHPMFHGQLERLLHKHLMGGKLDIKAEHDAS